MDLTPSADNLLGQNLVDAREEERRALDDRRATAIVAVAIRDREFLNALDRAHRAALARSDADEGHMTYTDGYADGLHDAVTLWKRLSSPAPLVDRDTGDEG